MPQDAARPCPSEARPSDGGTDAVRAAATPQSLSRFIWSSSARDQFWLALLSIVVFVAGIIPLELQRRIVNDAFAGGNVAAILHLAGTYAALAFAAGLLKLALNIYRGYVSENAVRRLRTALLDDFAYLVPESRRARAEGIEVSLVLDEADPVGGFVGGSVSEPLLQGGILVGVFAYMVYLQPLMALAALAVFSPQFVFVPLMQNAINRRIAFRVRMLRRISIGILAEPGGGAAEGSPQQTRIEHVFRINMGVLELKFTMNFLMNLMYHFGIAAILALGGYYVVKGETQVGTVVAFMSGLGQVNDPWGDLVNWFRDLRATQAKYDLIRRAVETLRSR